jgi:CheY-like chemotaxis protein
MMTSNAPGPLAGLRVFVAEDEFHVLQLIQDMLLDLGCAVSDSVSNMRSALERAASTQAQVALLDVDLRGQAIFPVAQVLRDREIPLLFSTGYGSAGIDAAWRDHPFIQKPFSIEELEAALIQLVPNLRRTV